MGLRQAAKLLAIPLPSLKWFRSSRVGDQVKVESPNVLWGFTQIGAKPVDYNVYVYGSLEPREAYKTACHETFHLAQASESKAGTTEEAAAEEFAERTTRTYYDQRFR